MSLQCVIVLLIVVVGANSCYGIKDKADLVYSNSRLTRDKVVALATPRRLLRSTAAKTVEASTNDQSYEERAPVQMVTGNMAKLALSMKVNPEVFYKRLRFSKAVGKLGDNPEFLAWLQYVLKYRAKTGDATFPLVRLLDLLRNTRPDRDLVELFQSLRRIEGMMNTADKMQIDLFERSPDAHRMMNEMWLKSRESPRDIFSILELNKVWKNQNLIQWLRYTEMYRNELGVDSFSVFQTNQLLLEHTSPARLVVRLESIKKTPDLEMLAESMQSQLLQRMKITPRELLTQHLTVASLPPKNDPRYKVLERYALLYAARRGGGQATMEQVKALFARGEIFAALNAAEMV
ncbi:hypothetical protein L917_18166 [Phytophthora nicotianae]|uniref:RXLR phytopathogen effector protein WY-domain domain-containing protein n=2 Tax=Phytophthora nicotianae TaxID=4792 RepID=V9E690_PHYNI|nr:hypothetical protein F443_19017 [Phytophthora nicotianae P1569]ETL81492.1 hypothetical protein L917_18166 [Phytophthora nicotianae]ETM34686.1 hypothetical protein L914_18252 [Phytophthora nicotianae]